MGEKSLLHLHEDLAAIGEQSMNPFRLLDAVDGERKIGAAHRLESVGGNVSAHHIRVAQVKAGI